MDDQIDSFLALAGVLDMCMQFKDGTVQPACLKQRCVDHLSSFLRAYGDVGWLPKHHLSLHLHLELKRFKTLLGLLVQERRHKVVKRWTKDRYSCKSFERGLIEEVTLEHLHQMESHWCRHGLVQPTQPKGNLKKSVHAAHPAATSILVSSKARGAKGSVVHAGDLAYCVVLGRVSLVEVWYHAEVDGQQVSCVSVWPHVPSPSCRSDEVSCHRRVDNPQLVPVECLVASVIFLQGDSDLVSVLMPPALR